MEKEIQILGARRLYGRSCCTCFLTESFYIYPSHDRESGVEENDNGDHFDMCDYHVFFYRRCDERNSDRSRSRTESFGCPLGRASVVGL